MRQNCFKFCIFHIAQVWNLTLRMLGTTDRPQLHAKAAESHGLLKFMACLLNSHLGRFQSLGEESYRKAKFLKEAAGAAVRFDEVFQTQHRRLNRSELQRAFQLIHSVFVFLQEIWRPFTSQVSFHDPFGSTCPVQREPQNVFNLPG